MNRGDCKFLEGVSRKNNKARSPISRFGAKTPEGSWRGNCTRSAPREEPYAISKMIDPHVESVTVAIDGGGFITVSVTQLLGGVVKSQTLEYSGSDLGLAKQVIEMWTAKISKRADLIGRAAAV